MAGAFEWVKLALDNKGTLLAMFLFFMSLIGNMGQGFHAMDQQTLIELTQNQVSNVAAQYYRVFSKAEPANEPAKRSKPENKCNNSCYKQIQEYINKLH